MYMSSGSHIPSSGPSSGISLELFHGLWKAMIAKTLVELGIPDQLTHSQKTVAELANATETRPELLYRFLRAAAACQFIQEVAVSEELPQRVFSSSENTHAMCQGQPTYFLIRHLLAGFEIDAWNHLHQNLRTGERAIDSVLGMPLWEYLDGHPQENRNFNGAMTTLSSAVNSPLVKAYPDFSRLEVVADIGGGQGGFLTAILQAYPTVRGMLFDRPQVMEQAKQQFTQAGVNDRCTCVPGSFLESIPPGANAYIFKNVLHDFDDAVVGRILEHVRRATQPDAKILIAELLIPESNPSFAVCGLDVEMLFETGGKQRTAQEFENLLREAHFSLERAIPVGRTPYTLLEGRAY